MIQRISVTRKGLDKPEVLLPHIQDACRELVQFLHDLDMFYTFSVTQARLAWLGAGQFGGRLGEFFNQSCTPGLALYNAFKKTGSRLVVNMRISGEKVLADLTVFDRRKNIKLAVQLCSKGCSQIAVVDMRF